MHYSKKLINQIWPCGGTGFSRTVCDPALTGLCIVRCGVRRYPGCKPVQTNYYKGPARSRILNGLPWFAGRLAALQDTAAARGRSGELGGETVVSACCNFPPYLYYYIITTFPPHSRHYPGHSRGWYHQQGWLSPSSCLAGAAC